ncbi:SixA phosphatase family protein [Pontibacter sp. H249]|uniref:SixA phosphatase family protein n=1 Tax=Pontibacter sp. H249 TaxID=3133420 RepID=UPI0030BFC4AB
MKTLYILRHAKSSWDFDELSDHDRPLNKRGRSDAQLMGQELANRSVAPALIVSSSAVRAITTATLVGKELNYNAEDIVVTDSVYGADKHELLDVVHNSPVEADAVMLVGHNEPISEFANMLSPEHIASLPTTGIVALEFGCDSWYDVSKENAKLLFYDFPKNYK